MTHDGQPFLGPRPFERHHHDRFFGRKRELADLVSLVIAHPIVFLYGQSGTGKTSLLNAGLIPKLVDDEGFDVFPVARPGGKADLSGAAAAQDSPYVFATLLTWAGSTASAGELANLSLATYLVAQPALIDDEGDPRPRLLIFDQLEELFRDQIDAEAGQRTFFEQVADVLEAAQGRGIPDMNGATQGQVPTRVLFSMREEFIAELDAVSGLFPNQLRIRQRLERLRPTAALEAVTGPLKRTSLAFAPGVAEQLVADLREVRVETGVGADRRAVNVLGEFVEPVQLQVVCQRLVRELPPATEQITFDHLARFGSVDATLEDFYQDAVAQAATNSGVKPDDLARWCEENLITATGTRGVVHRGPTHSDGIPNAAPDALVTGLLLRREPRAGAEWYELTHDRLIGPIQTARVERERREAEQRGVERARWLLRLGGSLATAAVLSVVLILVWASFYFGNQKPTCVSQNLTCAWEFHIGKFVFGRPAVEDTRAYVPSLDGNLYAIDTAQAKEMTFLGIDLGFVRYGPSRQMDWKFSTAGPIWSSPALHDGVLFFGSEDTALVAVATESGVKKWGLATNGAIVDSPTVVDGVVYFGSLDKNLYAADEASGTQLWRFPTGGAISSSPTVANELVYFGSNDFSVYAIDAKKGIIRWRFPTGHEVRSTPAVVDGTVFVGSFDHNVYAIDAGTGLERWVFKTGERVRSSPAVVDGIVYVGSYDNNVYALDAATGREIWRFETGEWVVASPLVHDGVVYVGSDDGNFYAIDAASGVELGRLVVGGLLESFPAVLGDQIIFGTGKGSVYAVDQVSPSGAPWPLLGIWATPAATPARATPVSS